MLETTENRNGSVSTEEPEIVPHRLKDVLTADELPGAKSQQESQKWEDVVFPLAPAMNGLGSVQDARPVLAVVCYEAPDSLVGRFVGQVAVALVKRKVDVHLFARHDFNLDAAGVAVHALGESSEGGLVEQVQEFTERACNAFLKLFPNGSGPITLMGYEWSAAPALSVLGGIRMLDTILSLHSLERQRSDLSSDLSKKIEEIELAGLREAKTLWIHEPATAEVAKFWVPECAERIVLVRQRFQAELFANQIDAGAVKARYQVGPLDPMILCIGDLNERYGPDLLIKAMPAVLKNHGQARLVIVGDGGLLWPLKVYTRYLLLEHAVRVPGSVEGQALRELVQAADVVAVPSRESTPWWPILAAWAAGRPVVATHPAAPGLLQHEQDSVICYPNENSCVWGVERVLYDPELAAKMAQKGGRKLEERFGWNTVAAQLQELMGVLQAR